MTAVAFAGVTLRLGRRVVLDEVSLSIGAGEFIGVLGPNGAGKTTLMQAVLGLVRPVQGTISILGQAPRRGDPRIGYVPQTRTHMPDLALSGRALIASSIRGERWGLPVLRADDRRALEAALEAVSAAELARRPLGELSGGERQRVLLAQALVGEPRLLLLDEPLIGLDPAHQEAVVTLVARLARQRGITVLFSAHEMNQLLGAVDRILYLGGGSAALGRPDEVARPDVLSRLFGIPIEVIRAGGRIFVVSSGRSVEAHDHAHDHDGDHHHPHLRDHEPGAEPVA